MSNIKFSIITVCYNSGDQISEAIESVAQQEYSDIEYIVVDGSSTDNTLDIIDSYKSKINVVISEPDKGIYDAMNKGISAATGDIIGILNSDDFYRGKNTIEKVSRVFQSSPDTDVVLAGVDFVNSQNLSCVRRVYRSSGFKRWMMYFGVMPPHPGVFIRKSVIEDIGLYSLEYKIASDFDYLLRLLLKRRVNYTVMDEIAVRMREGGVSTAGISSNIRSTREMYRALRNNEIFSSYLLLALRFPYKYVTQVLNKN